MGGGGGGRVFSTYTLLDDSNFVQNYFGGRINILEQKNQDQIDNDVTMASSLL